MNQETCLQAFFCYNCRRRGATTITTKEERSDRVLAGLRALAVRFRAASWNRRRRIRVRVMDWWHKVIFPMRRAWIAVAARVRARENGWRACYAILICAGGGLLKLHDDVQTCGYEDVQVMWEMLRRYEASELPQPAKRKRPFWRLFLWSSTRSSQQLRT